MRALLKRADLNYFVQGVLLYWALLFSKYSLVRIQIHVNYIYRLWLRKVRAIQTFSQTPECENNYKKYCDERIVCGCGSGQGRGREGQCYRQFYTRNKSRGLVISAVALQSVNIHSFAKWASLLVYTMAYKRKILYNIGPGVINGFQMSL